MTPPTQPGACDDTVAYGLTRPWSRRETGEREIDHRRSLTLDLHFVGWLRSFARLLLERATTEVLDTDVRAT